MDIRFDTYYDDAQLEKALRHLVAEYPKLAELTSIGESHEGRDVWALTITNSQTGPAHDKAALLVSGNIHGQEVATAMACLHAAHRLLSGHGNDERITRLLDRHAFYVLPRLNPDGAARAFMTPPTGMINGARPHPHPDEGDGLYPDDIDGDGRILEMRIPDPNGPLKVSDEDPRLMVRRDPDEEGGTYYRVFPEGRIRNYDGHTIRMARELDGVNLNRNFPANWAGEASQGGAGPYPGSEAETRALMDFVNARPNIASVVDYHTYSGVHLRPYSYRPDNEMPAQDLWTYELIGEQATALTGYPAISIFHDFRYHPQQVLHGAAIDWFYDELGVVFWTTELWDACTHAELGDRGNVVDWLRDHPESDDLRLLRWSDEQIGGRAYVDWYAFDHPQLGPVELGGWDRLFTWNNPPEELLEGELVPNTEFVVYSALLLPRLAVRDLSTTPLGDGHHTITLVVENTGFLPTYVTQKALEKRAARPIRVEVSGAEIITGAPKTEIGHLEGRASKRHMTMVAPAVASTTDDRTVCEWVVAGQSGSVVRLDVLGDRAGTLRLEVTLE